MVWALAQKVSAIEEIVSPFLTLYTTPVTGGIAGVSPGLILSTSLISFSHLIESTEILKFLAIWESDSPPATSYLITSDLGRSSGMIVSVVFSLARTRSLVKSAGSTLFTKRPPTTKAIDEIANTL